MESRTLATEQATVLKWFKENGVSYAFDTETNGAKYDQLVAKTFQFHNGTNYLLVYINDRTLPTLVEVFKSIKTLICHNITYDLQVCKKYNIPFEHIKLYDTMIAQHLIDEESELGLKFLARTILGFNDVVDYKQVAGLSETDEKFIEYALADVKYTWLLAKWQQVPMKEQGLVDVFRNIEMPFVLCIIDMETNGILIDDDEVQNTTAELRKKSEELVVQMHHILGKKYRIQMDLLGSSTIVSDINFNSSKQLGDILFKDLGLPQTEKTESGVPSVGKDAIDDLKGKHPFVDMLIQYKIVQKLLSSFFEPMPEHIQKDGRIRARFNDCGTATGRLSCTNPNLQQLPKVNKAFPIDTRKCFTVADDEVMISADYSGQELRVLAHITQEKNLIDSFNKGRDLHLATANEFFDCKIPEEALYENVKDYEIYKKKFNSERNKAKIINFGIAYGKGAYGFAQDFGTSEDEAQKILDKYFGANPGVKRSIDACTSQVKRDSFVASITGRRRRFKPFKDSQGNVYFSKSSFRQAFNFLIQGYSADMVRLAGNACYKLKKEHPEWNLKFLATIHDEILFSCKKEYQKICSEEIKKGFETAVTLAVPLVSSIATGKNYGECK